MRYIVTIAALGVGNFIGDADKALERTVFQAIAVFVVWLNNKLCSK